MTAKFVTTADTVSPPSVTVTALKDGRVLAAGGGFPAVANTAVYDPHYRDTRRPFVAVRRQSSPANAPIFRLQRVNGDALTFVSPQSWSPSSLTASVAGMIHGYYRLAVVSNVVPSVEQLVRIGSAPLVLGNYPDRQTVSGLPNVITPSVPRYALPPDGPVSHSRIPSERTSV